MPDEMSGKKALGVDRGWARGPVLVERRRGRFVFFTLVLGAYDFALALGGWAVFSWLYDAAVIDVYGLRTGASLLFSAMLTVVFFPAYQLYSHHLIFSKKKHIRHVMKALLSASGCFALLSFYYAFSVNSVLIILLVCLVVAFIVSRSANRAAPNTHYNLFRLVGICLLAAGFLGYINEGQVLVIVREPVFVAFGFAFSAVVVLVARMFLVHVVFNDWLRRRFRRQVAVMGSDEQARRIVSHVLAQNAPFWVAGTIGAHCALGTSVEKHCLGPIERLPALVVDHRIDELIITDQGMDKRTLICVLDFCLSNGIPVWLPPNLLDIIDQKLHINSFCGLPMVKLCSTRYPCLANRSERLMDIVISFPLLVVLLPLFGLIAAAVKLTSPGPVLYRSVRIGRDGGEFDMLKFRSMRVDSDDGIHKAFVTKLIKGETDAGDAEGRPLKIVDDPRITAVGGFLRRTSLDELPQLINVITGDMSLVGPRPCLPYEFEIYQDWYRKRACVRPGITGMWQVAGRSEVAFEDMILLDLYYIYNRGLWLNLNILIETVFVLLEKRGAY